MTLADDLGPEHVAEHRQLGIARRAGALGNVVDRAVVLAQSERPVFAEEGLGKVAGLVLDDRELADPLGQGRILGQVLGDPAANPVADLLPSDRKSVV